MSACHDWNDRLLDLALGALNAPEAGLVEAHLARCPACAAALSELRWRAEEMDAAVRQLVRGAEPPPGFGARVLANVEARPAFAPGRRLGRVGILAALLVSALILAAILRPFLGRWWPGPRQPTGERMATVSTWRSPTEGLLHSPGDELLRSAPRLGELYFRLEPSGKEPGRGNGGNHES